jgi:type IV secretion system protein VirD4
MMKKFDYESDWSAYAFPNTHSVFATDDYIFDTFSKIDLISKKYKSSGIPLAIKKGDAVIVDDDSHTIIYGETGSKKTRCCIKPLITTIAGAQESMIVTDVKGELASDHRIRGWLSQNGFESVVLDFRDFNCDGYNILQYPFELYQKGEKDKAMANIIRLISSLTNKYIGTKADPFWNDMAFFHIIPLIQIFFEACKHKRNNLSYLNLLSLSTYISHDIGTIARILNIISEKTTANNAVQMLNSVLSSPDKTRGSIISTTNSLFKNFVFQVDLMKMLSVSTFNIREAYEKPMCVFLIIPDETSAYDELTGVVIDNFYSQLIDVHKEEYQKTGKTPAHPINFVCDEFCNVKIRDMSAKISASRSRSMRWYLVCQSKNQLESSYENEAATIIGNCKNIIFLQSSDYEMLSYISRQCGTTNITQDGIPEPLITPEELSKFEKHRTHKEALFIRDDIRYCARLPDFDRYIFLKEYENVREDLFVNKLKRKKISVYDPKMMFFDINNKKIPIPLSNNDFYNQKEKNNEDTEKLRRELENVFNDNPLENSFINNFGSEPD